MSFPALSAVVATAARSAGASTHADVTDGELLRTYARSRGRLRSRTSSAGWGRWCWASAAGLPVTSTSRTTPSRRRSRCSPAAPATSARPRPSAPGCMGSPSAPPGRLVPCPPADWPAKCPCPPSRTAPRSPRTEPDVDALRHPRRGDRQPAGAPPLRGRDLRNRWASAARTRPGGSALRKGRSPAGWPRRASSWPSDCGSAASRSRQRWRC